MTRYRKDIDGLRSFAVFAVIVNHADPHAFASGYLGVDVFFVISGYVIARSLIGSVDKSLGKFLKEFYTRRIKRLMPALILCVLVCSGVLVMIDPEPTVSLWTGAASLLGAANIYLYFQQLDYFATDIALNAFTHTWSLGVEEQFYLLLPVLFWFATRGNVRERGTFLLWLIGLLSVLSLGLFVILREAQPVASFYMIHTRFWELGAGVFLAVLLDSRVVGTPVGEKRVSWIGWQGLFLFGLLGVMSMSEFDTRILTLMTVVLTLMVIGTSDRTWLTENSISVYLGRISYSLYLWHWPLLVLELLAPDTIWTAPLSLIALLFVTAMLSYHLVEQPLRHRSWSAGQSLDLLYGFMVSAVCIGLLAILSVHVLKTKAFAERNMSLEQPTLPLPSGDPYDPTCVVDGMRRLLKTDTFEKCTFQPRVGSGAPTIWTIGDSHAGHFQGLLVELYHDIGIGIHLVETVGEFFPPSAENNPTSRLALVDEMRRNIVAGDVVFLSRLYLTRTSPPTVKEDVVADWAPKLGGFLREMAEKSVIVVISGPPPIFNFSDIRACSRDNPDICGVPRAQLITPVSKVEAMLKGLAERHENLRILRIFDVLCPDGQDVCVPVHDGVFTMRDSDHLNVYGASLLKDRFIAVIGFDSR